MEKIFKICTMLILFGGFFIICLGLEVPIHKHVSISIILALFYWVLLEILIGIYNLKK